MLAAMFDIAEPNPARPDRITGNKFCQDVLRIHRSTVIANALGYKTEEGMFRCFPTL